MLCPSTENPLCPWLMSGGRSSMPMFRQVRVYSDTFLALSMTDVIRAAMNSTG